MTSLRPSPRYHTYSAFPTPASASPLDVSDFRRRLLASWRPRHPRPGPHLLGIAVSGGVDSLALACLCKRLHIQDPRLFRFKAFVVDHNARQNSAAEAAAVASVLRSKVGIAAQVLRLTWPDRAQPLELDNFETRARRLRFRSLGLACRAAGVDALLLGHHADDQAETVLLRIVEGKTGPGLQGIKEKATIPECDGIFDVSQGSGHSPVEQDHGPMASTRSQRPPALAEVAGPGLQLYRPLLGVSKETLAATCRASGISWLHDATNDDPSLTVRNTVRHLLEKKALPASLRRTSLRELSSKFKTKIQRAAVIADESLRAFEFTSLDLRSGVFAFASSNFLNLLQDKSAPLAAKRALVSRLVQTVSPYDITETSKLDMIANHCLESSKSSDLDPKQFPNGRDHISAPLFPNKEVDHLSPVTGRNASALTASWPQREREDVASKWCLPQLPSYIFSACGVEWRRAVDSGDLGPSSSLVKPVRTSQWLLSRQCPSRLIAQPPCAWEPAATTRKSRADAKEQSYGLWQLFDGRYWLRVLNPMGHRVVARFFQEGDLKPFLQSFQTHRKAEIRRALSKSAHAKIRWTLPAIASSVEAGSVIALPTFGFQVPSDFPLQCEILYKNIGLEPDYVRQMRNSNFFVNSTYREIRHKHSKRTGNFYF